MVFNHHANLRLPPLLPGPFGVGTARSKVQLRSEVLQKIADHIAASPKAVYQKLSGRSSAPATLVKTIARSAGP